MILEMRKQNNHWLGQNTDYKQHSGDSHFEWKIKWWLELSCTLRIMGEAAPLMYYLTVVY